MESADYSMLTTRPGHVTPRSVSSLHCVVPRIITMTESQALSTVYVLNAYLYDTNNVVDRLVNPNGRVLRNESNNKKARTTRNNKKSKEVCRKAICKLEKEMDRLTDLTIVSMARESQKCKHQMSPSRCTGV